MPSVVEPVHHLPSLPGPRGEISDALLRALAEAPHETDLPAPVSADPLRDEDLQLSLYLIYELHYRGYEGVAPEWEWSPSLLTSRLRLEKLYTEALEELVPPAAGATDPESVGETLFELAANDDGPSLSRYLETRGSEEELREFMVHKSAYQLKEADPHSWVIPRVSGDAKSALLEIQYDEYGSGRPERLHARLYAKAMRALELDDDYGAYLDLIPGTTLATNTLTTLLGLRRGRRGALIGHLAMFEIGSAIPSRRYGNAIRRLGLATPDAVDFFDEHVEADSVHENIAAYDLAQRFALAEPELAGDVLFGARALLAVDGLFAGAVMNRWKAGESSLLRPLTTF